MKIIALPDLHNAIDSLTTISEIITAGQIILLVGDITKSGNLEDAKHVIRTVQNWNRSILAVPGNWDGPETEGFLEDEKINLNKRNVVIKGIEFLGIGASLPTGLNAPNEKTEEAFVEITEKMLVEIKPIKPYLLISHQPPAQTINDQAWNGLHVGSKAIRKFIEETQPLVCFTGHIHEGVGIDQIGNSYIINPGPLWQGQYAYVEIENGRVTVLEIRSANH